MINSIKLNLYRMIHNKAFLLMPFVITPIIICCAMYFSSNVVVNPTIGVVNKTTLSNDIKNVNIVNLNEKVPLSDLVKNKYDAVVYFDNDKVTVDTIKGQDYKERVEKLFNGENTKLNDNENRSAGVNIIGYVSMFLLFLGGKLYKFFFDDKMFISKRIISCGMSYSEYAVSHAASVFLMIFVPTCIVTILFKELFNINTNITDLEFIFIIFLLCFLSSSFGFLIASLVDNDTNAGMLGNMIIIAASLISGSIVNISNNKIINALGSVIPQKYLISTAISFENNNVNITSILFVLLSSVIMMVIAFEYNKYKMRVSN